jgi:hypothetical protein
LSSVSKVTIEILDEQNHLLRSLVVVQAELKPCSWVAFLREGSPVIIEHSMVSQVIPSSLRFDTSFHESRGFLPSPFIA